MAPGAAPGNSQTLADQLSRLARAMQHETDVQGTLDAIVHAAVVTIPGGGVRLALLGAGATARGDPRVDR